MLRLYSKLQCPLCEEAIEIIGLVGVRTEDLEIIDITTEGSLFRRYGTQIPVVVNLDSQEELGWPFGVADVTRLLNIEPGS